MGFDAGSLIAYLKLDRTDFDKGIDEAKAKADELDGKEITVKVKADSTELDRDAVAVDAVKREVSKPVTIKVKVDGADAAASELKAFEQLARDLTGDGSGLGSTISQMLTGGASPSEISSVLSDWNTPATRDALSRVASMLRSDAQQALTHGESAISARQLVDSLLPSPQQFQHALTNALGSGLYQMPRGTSESLWASIAKDAFGAQSALGGGGSGGLMELFTGGASSAGGARPGIGSTIFGSGGAGGAGANAAADFAKAWRKQMADDVAQGQYDIFNKAASSFTNPWKTLFQGTSGVESQLRDWASKAGVNVGDDFIKFMSKGITDSAKDATSGGWVQKLGQDIVTKLGSKVQSVSQAVSGLGPLGTGISFLAPLVPMLASALGLAGAGAVAGTAIGGIGMGVYGLLAMGAIKDLSTAYSAQQSLKTGATTQAQYNQSIAGLTPAAVTAIQGGLGAGLTSFNDNVIHPLQDQVVTQIIGLFNALVKDLPLVVPFMKTVVDVMGQFFDKIDKGLGSGGFANFVKTMTKDVGPIMKDFGDVVINLGHAFGSFLEIFGGKPAQMVGDWFKRITGNLSDWLSHVKITPQMLDDMTKSFNFLGAVLDLIWQAFKKLWDALYPIGKVLIEILTPAIQGLTWAIKLIPVDVLTAIGALLLGWLAYSSPIGELVLLLTALGLALKFISTVGAPALPVNLTDALKAFNTPADQRTPAQVADVNNAGAHGLTGADVATAVFGQQTPANTNPNSSAADSVVLNPSGGPPRLTPAGVDTGKAGGAVPKAAWIQDITDVGHVFRTVWRDMRAVVLDTQNWFTQTIPHAISVTSGAFTTGFQSVHNIVNTVWHAIDNDVFHNIADFLVNTIPHAISVTSGSFTTGFQSVHNIVNTAWHAIDNDVLHPLENFFTVTIPGLLKGFVAFWKQAWSDAKTWANDGWQFIDNNVVHPIVNFLTVTIPGAVTTFVNFWKQGWSDVKSWGSEAWHFLDANLVQPLVNFFTVTIPHTFDTVVSWFHDLPGKIGAAIGSGLDVLSKWGTEIIQGVANAISGAGGLITGALHSVISSIPGASWVLDHIGLGSLVGPAAPSAASVVAGLDPAHLAGNAAGTGMGTFQGMSIVGERGPEIANFGTPVQIIPNGYRPAGSGSNVIHITVDARGAQDPAATRKAATSGVTSSLPALRAALERGAA